MAADKFLDPELVLLLSDEAVVYSMAESGLVKTESTQYQRTYVLSFF
jgi:hypothetical protein